MRANIYGSCPSSQPPTPVFVLSRAARSLLMPQPILILRNALTQVKSSGLGFVEPWDVPMGTLLKHMRVPLDDISSFGVSTAPLILVSSADLLRMSLIPLSVSLVKTLKSTGPSKQPRGHLSPISCLTETLTRGWSWVMDVAIQPNSLSTYSSIHAFSYV